MSLIDQAKEQMAKTVENTKENFSGIRTGRANPALLNGITVDYYGAPTPIKAVASIGVPEPRTLSVTPFDASQAGAVEKISEHIRLISSLDLSVSVHDPQITMDIRRYVYFVYHQQIGLSYTGAAFPRDLLPFSHVYDED